MTGLFVSYAQNFEDVMLWRALRHVDEGFYVDVGAWSPIEHSVTQAFYERGWRGINVEPNPEYQGLLVQKRPRDVNLSIAISDRSEMLRIYLVPGTGLSTIDERQARERASEGFNVSRLEVQAETLASILDRHVPTDQSVHFLKVDTEGSEHEVLLGNDWKAHRPWIVLVEATMPTTPEPSHGPWEGTLLDAGYRLVYSDGLNRYYVADEHADLIPAFGFPPNVFDGFIRYTEADAIERAARAEAELAAILGSRSWRLTAPLRAGARLVRSVRLATRNE